MNDLTDDPVSILIENGTADSAFCIGLDTDDDLKEDTDHESFQVQLQPPVSVDAVGMHGNSQCAG